MRRKLVHQVERRLGREEAARVPHWGRRSNGLNIVGFIESEGERMVFVVNSNYKTLQTSPLLGKDSGLIELFESLPDKSSE
jgi:hypothetical protein